MIRAFWRLKLAAVIFTLILFVNSVSAVWAFPSRAPELQMIDVSTRVVEESWLAFDKQYQGGLEIAAGDLGSDGEAEIVVAQSGGTDARGRVRTFRQDHSLIAAWTAFPELIDQSEISLAVGDVDGDQRAEIVVALPRADMSLVHIFDGEGKFDPLTIGAFNAFPGNTAGASVAVGNVVGDSAAEIIVATGAGAAPAIRIFDKDGNPLVREILPFNNSDTYGLSVAAINTDGGAYDEIVVGFQNGGATWIKIYKVDAAQTVLAEFETWTKQFDSGVQLAPWDVDGDGTAEIVVVPAGDQRAEIKAFRGDGKQIDFSNSGEWFVFEEDFRGGADILVIKKSVQQSAAITDSTVAVATTKLIITPHQQRRRGDLTREPKYIETNLTKQTTYLWEDGYMRNAYLISSGLPATPTPEGDFKISAKIERHVYDGRPEYYFPNTPWNLRFNAQGPGRNMYYHTAYWHNDFGRPKSHGCINMREADAKFLYFWADIDTSVWIHK